MKCVIARSARSMQDMEKLLKIARAVGLTDIRIVRPDAAALQRVDTDGTLHKSDPEACCAVRKVEPMARGVEPFGAWLTGRKRFQAATRAALPVFDVQVFSGGARDWAMAQANRVRGAARNSAGTWCSRASRIRPAGAAGGSPSTVVCVKQ